MVTGHAVAVGEPDITPLIVAPVERVPSVNVPAQAISDIESDACDTNGVSCEPRPEAKMNSEGAPSLVNFWNAYVGVPSVDIVGLVDELIQVALATPSTLMVSSSILWILFYGGCGAISTR